LNSAEPLFPYNIPLNGAIESARKGSAMKTGRLCVFVTVLLISSYCVAQEHSKKDTAPNSTKILTVFGKVSSDARTLLTDLDSEWKVANASILTGYEDRLVRVRCYIDAEKNQLHILSIKKENAGETYAARYADSAFRR
jgi:hypothetical protein